MRVGRQLKLSAAAQCPRKVQLQLRGRAKEFRQTGNPLRLHWLDLRQRCLPAEAVPTLHWHQGSHELNTFLQSRSILDS